MARLIETTITANSVNTLAWALTNARGDLNHYTVHATGTFGSGTLAFFTNSQGVATAQAGTTHDAAILNSGVAQTLTANGSFNFECNSDPTNPTAFKAVLSGANNPSIILTVDSVK